MTKKSSLMFYVFSSVRDVVWARAIHQCSDESSTTVHYMNENAKPIQRHRIYRYSGEPRILEWEGSRCRRGLGRGEGVSPSPLGDESGEGAVPPLRENVRIFMSENI